MALVDCYDGRVMIGRWLWHAETVQSMLQVSSSGIELFDVL